MGSGRYLSDIATLRGMGGAPSYLSEQSMCLSVKTVEAHLTRIFRKFGVASRSALVSEYLHAAGAADH
jgi:DNA-binding CsgD family transcriptional regulator